MRPIFNPPKPQTLSTTSTMSRGGINARDLPQLLSPNYCLDMINYFLTSDGGLNKRKGITELFSVAGTDGIVMLERWTSDLYLFGYKQTLAVYRISTGTVTNIKTNFVYSGSFSCATYSDYFFVASPSDPIGRISQTLNYDTQTGNFTVGQIVTGGISGATATILEDSDSGATGTLTLGSVSGTFQNNDTLTDPITGVALANGTLNFVYTPLTAPNALVIKAAGARLYAGLADGTVRYAETDDGTNPPFDNWTVGTAATDPGQVSYRNAGKVNSIEPLGNLMLVFGDTGKWAFHQETIDSSGTLVKVDITDIFRNDSGGGRGAKSCKAGLFYVNGEGLWQLVAVGQQNIKYSDQESVATLLLGTTYFDDFDYTNCDITYIPKKQTLLLTGAKDSSKNNIILTYNTEFKAIGKFTGMNVNRFMDDNGTLYGTATNSNTVFKLFEGYSDNGSDIWCEYYQELKTAGLEQASMMVGQYCQGFLSPSSNITMAFDIYTVKGNFVKDKLRLSWTPADSSLISDGYGVTSWGVGSIGSDVETAGMLESFAGFRGRISNYQRIRVRFTEHSKLPLALNWFSIQTLPKAMIRRRNLTQL